MEMGEKDRRKSHRHHRFGPGIRAGIRQGAHLHADPGRAFSPTPKGPIYRISGRLPDSRSPSPRTIEKPVPVRGRRGAVRRRCKGNVLEIKIHGMAEGKMTNRQGSGQSLLEVAIGLTLLLILLLGAYASTRPAILTPRSESVAFAEALRAGRNLPGIEQELSRSILPEGKEVDIRSGRGKQSRLLPSPFPLLAGKTTATAEVRHAWREIETPRWLPPAKILRTAELHADCWGKTTSSGKSIQRWIQGYVLLGGIR